MSMAATDLRDQVTPVSSWLGWSAAAFGFSLFHTLINYHIGLLGKTAPAMSSHEAAAAFATSAVFAWWLLMIGTATQGGSGAQWSNILLIVFMLCAGLAGLFSPRQPYAYPYHAIAHVGIFMMGGV